MPGLHGQRLALGPEPDEIDAQHHEHEGLQRMAVVHGIACLRQGAEQIACNEDHAEQQHALVEPAGHAPRQSRGHLWGGCDCGCRGGGGGCGVRHADGEIGASVRQCVNARGAPRRAMAGMQHRGYHAVPWAAKAWL